MSFLDIGSPGTKIKCSPYVHDDSTFLALPCGISSLIIVD